MADQLMLIQILGDNTIIPLVTSAQGETEAAETMERYPEAGYHFFYANVVLEPLLKAELP